MCGVKLPSYSQTPIVQLKFRNIIINTSHTLLAYNHIPKPEIVSNHVFERGLRVVKENHDNIFK